MKGVPRKCPEHSGRLVIKELDTSLYASLLDAINDPTLQTTSIIISIEALKDLVKEIRDESR